MTSSPPEVCGSKASVARSSEQPVELSESGDVVAVALVATGLQAPAGGGERAGERGEVLPASSTILTSLRSAISCAWPKRPKPVTSVTALGSKGRSVSAALRVQIRHGRGRRGDLLLIRGLLASGGERRGPSQEASSGRSHRPAGLRSSARSVGVHGADHGEAVLGLVVADGVAAGQEPPLPR